MDRVWLPGVVGVLSLAVVLTLYLRQKIGRMLARRRARQRSRRAASGEVRAETLLERLGYSIEGRQVPCSWTIWVDGEESAFPMRADLLVARGDRRYVAEVKTGNKAPKLSTAATRRQLLEYRLAYDVDGVLLVDAERDRVLDVEFPLPGRGRSSGRWLPMVGMWLLGAVTGVLGAWWLL